MRTSTIGWWRWVWVVVWLLVIGWFSTDIFSSTQTVEYFGEWNYEARLAAHLSVYAALAALLASALAAGGGNEYKAAVIASLSAAVIALLDEWHQSGLLDRSGRFSDVMRDYCGASLGVLAWLSMYKLGELLEYVKGAYPVIYGWSTGLGSWIRAGVELGLTFGMGLYFWLYLHRAADATSWELLVGGLKIAGVCVLLGAITGGVRGLIFLLNDVVRYCMQQMTVE